MSLILFSGFSPGFWIMNIERQLIVLCPWEEGLGVYTTKPLSCNYMENESAIAFIWLAFSDAYLSFHDF